MMLPEKLPLVPPVQKVVSSLKTWHSSGRGVVPVAVMEMLWRVWCQFACWAVKRGAGDGRVGEQTYGCAGSWSSQNQVWLTVRAYVLGSNRSDVPIWYLSGRRNAVCPAQDSGWAPATPVSTPPQDAVYPRRSFRRMMKAFPLWRLPATDLKFSCVAATSHSGVLESAVQPLVS